MLGAEKQALQEPRNHAAELIALVRQTPHMMGWLAAVRELQLDSWCIGAGAVRNLVWDAIQGYPAALNMSDVDVAFFDASDLSSARDQRLQSMLGAAVPEVPWEVTNQAGVHVWFEQCFGHAVEPLHSLEDAISTWPEFATCVGVWLDDADEVHVIAPFGLANLFSMTVRRNPKRVSVETYQKRCREKRYAERWPSVRIVAA